MAPNTAQGVRSSRHSLSQQSQRAKQTARSKTVDQGAIRQVRLNQQKFVGKKSNKVLLLETRSRKSGVSSKKPAFFSIGSREMQNVSTADVANNESHEVIPEAALTFEKNR